MVVGSSIPEPNEGWTEPTGGWDPGTSFARTTEDVGVGEVVAEDFAKAHEFARSENLWIGLNGV